MMENRLMTSPEVAKYLGITEAGMTGLRKRGEGPTYFKVGKLYKYKKEDVESWIAKNTVAAKND